MWDGKFITFGDQDFSSGTSGVYQATQNASGGLALAGKTKLADPCGFNNDVIQPFILGRANTPENMQQGTIVIGSNNGCFNVVDLWSYPAGGTPTRGINPPDKVLFGAVVSIRETPRP
jgi:hypothetical protein